MINNALSSKVKVRVTCIVAAQCLWGRGENDTMRWKHSWRQWYLTQGMVRSSRRDVFPVRFWPISPVWLMAESSVPNEEEEGWGGRGRGGGGGNREVTKSIWVTNIDLNSHCSRGRSFSALRRTLLLFGIWDGKLEHRHITWHQKSKQAPIWLAGWETYRESNKNQHHGTSKVLNMVVP